MYDCYFTNILTQRSCFEVLLTMLTADSQCFTPNDARIFVPTIPRRRRAFTLVGTSRFSFTAILRAVWSIFFSPGAPVTSFLYQPIFTVIPVAVAFNKTTPALSSIAVVTKASKRTARTSLCRIWEHPQRCSRHLDKNRAKHRRTVFSMNEAQESSSDQRADEEDTSETCNNNHVGGRALTNAQKRS